MRQLLEESERLPDWVLAQVPATVSATLRKDTAARPTAAELALYLQPLVAELPRDLRVGPKGVMLSLSEVSSGQAP